MFAKESCEVSAQSLPRSFATETLSRLQVCEISASMADRHRPEDKLAVLLEDGVAPDEIQVNITTVFISLNNVWALATSMKEMGNALVDLRRPNVKTTSAKRDSGAVHLTNEKC